jgi:hypothetical protein
MGNYLNPQYDNILFSIFGSPSRFHWSYAQLKPYFNIFEKVHRGQKLSLNDWMLLGNRVFEKHNRKNNLRNIKYALRSGHTKHDAQYWGWKNGPNQYFLPQLNQQYPNCFYVHTIRHGLDMAFSNNLRELNLWGPHFDIHSDQREQVLPVQQLIFWIKTNQWITEYCHVHLPSRHYILRFDELCRFPEKVISELRNAIRLQSDSSMTELINIVEPPESLGRYKMHDISLFNPAQIAAVQELGFHV